MGHTNCLRGTQRWLLRVNAGSIGRATAGTGPRRSTVSLPDSDLCWNSESRPRRVISVLAIQFLRPRDPKSKNSQNLQDRRRVQAIDSHDEWRKTHVGAVLGTVADRISQSVLYELVLNSLWHSDSEYVITVSDFERTKNLFRFAVYDNGRSIQSTLRRTGLPLDELQRQHAMNSDATFTIVSGPEVRNGVRRYKNRTKSGLELANALQALPEGDAEIPGSGPLSRGFLQNRRARQPSWFGPFRCS